MKKVKWSRKTVSVILLAMVLPISLTVVFQLTRGITISDTLTLEPVTWTFQRPSDPEVDININETLEALYDYEISMKLSILVWTYVGNCYSDGTDCLSIMIGMNSTGSNPDAWIRSFYIVLRDCQASGILFDGTDLYLENLTVSDSKPGYTQAFMKLDGVRNPNKVHLKKWVLWKLPTPKSESHQMEIVSEITYYNGTAHNKIVQPFQLNILGSSPN